MRNKLGIIVPYRNRPNNLNTFYNHMTEYFSNKDIRYEIFIIDQDNAKQFNRGKLLNIGFKYAEKAKCNYVVFHDIDMLPVDVDYSYSDIPLHLSTNFLLEPEQKRDDFDEYFGGVTLFPTEDFKKINGYSNKYWAWGYEDTDLLYRCVKAEVPLNDMLIKNMGRKGKFLKFNGINSYVKTKNIIDLNNNSTFFISFYPEKLLLNHENSSDEFTTFSIPGWDFAVSYTSFSRYNFCTFDSSHNALYVNSKIKTNYKTNLVVTLNRDENKIKVYQDGEFIGETPYYKKLYFYKKEKFFYLGVGNPNREKKPNYFVGHIDSFAYFDSILNESEIKEISTNDVYLLRRDFGDYKSSKDLKCYYDARYIKKYILTDLSGNENHGEIFNCDIVDLDFSDYKEIKVPHKRESLFKLLKHDNNGFIGNGWKDQATRWNQLRFHNEISMNDDLILNDGLIDLNYTEHGKQKINKITHINVGL